MCKGVAFFLCERVYSFDGGEFGSGELSEALFGFDDLFRYDFKIFICVSFVERLWFGRFYIGFGRWLHLNFNYKAIASLKSNKYKQIVASKSIEGLMLDDIFLKLGESIIIKEMKKMLLMGYSGAGKTSMHSVIFANFPAKDTQKIGYTVERQEHKFKFMGTLTLNLWDCGGQDTFMEQYFLVQKETIFRGV